MDGIRDELIAVRQTRGLKFPASCECMKEYEADKVRFAREAAEAFEEDADKYDGSEFVPMRYVKPPRPFQPTCVRRCPESLDLLARHSQR